MTGAILEIYNSGEVIVARYVYDAFGNHKVYDGYYNVNTNDSFIGNINPFRYKSYYYDKESNLYYLNSRYYSPIYYRFISIDDIDYLKSESINGINLYTYCGNDPINYTDQSGHFPWLVLAAFLFIGVTRAAANAIGQYQSSGEINWFEVAVEGVYGGIMGVLTIATAGMFSITNLAIRIGVTAFAIGLKDGLLMYNDTRDVNKAGMAGLEGALKGGLIGFVSYVVFLPSKVTQLTFATGALSGSVLGYISGLKDKNQKIKWPWMWEAIFY